MNETTEEQVLRQSDYEARQYLEAVNELNNIEGSTIKPILYARLIIPPNFVKIGADRFIK